MSEEPDRNTELTYGLLYDEDEHTAHVVKALELVVQDDLLTTGRAIPNVEDFTADLVGILRWYVNTALSVNPTGPHPTKKEVKYAQKKIQSAIDTLDKIPTSVDRHLYSYNRHQGRSELRPLAKTRVELERLSDLLEMKNPFVAPLGGRPSSKEPIEFLLRLRIAVDNRLEIQIPKNSAKCKGRNSTTGDEEDQFERPLVEGFFRLANSLDASITRKNVATSLSK